MDAGRDRRLYARWGLAGPALWMRFLQACKGADLEGRVAFEDEDDLRVVLGVAHWELADGDGKPFTLAEFFAWTGQRKWTKRNRVRDGRPWVECRGWDELQRRRHRGGIDGEPTGDRRVIDGSSRETRRSDRKNVQPDRTGQDSTTTGGVVLSPESSDAPSARSPQGARSGRSGEDEDHPDHEVGEPCRVLCQAHRNCARDCFACQQLKERTA